MGKGGAGSSARGWRPAQCRRRRRIGWWGQPTGSTLQWARAPAQLARQPLQVLRGRDQQRFAVDLLQSAQTEAPPLPVVCLCEHRLHPHLALVAARVH